MEIPTRADSCVTEVKITYEQGFLNSTASSEPVYAKMKLDKLCALPWIRDQRPIRYV